MSVKENPDTKESFLGIFNERPPHPRILLLKTQLHFVKSKKKSQLI